MRNFSTTPSALAAILTLATATLAGCSRDTSEAPAAPSEARHAAGPCETPLETRQRNVPEQQPTRPDQTRACAATTTMAFDVTVLTDDLDHPWAV